MQCILLSEKRWVELEVSNDGEQTVPEEESSFRAQDSKKLLAALEKEYLTEREKNMRSKEDYQTDKCYSQ